MIGRPSLVVTGLVIVVSVATAPAVTLEGKFKELVIPVRRTQKDPTKKLADGLADSVARSLPLIAASAGYTQGTGTAARLPGAQSFLTGQLLLEHAQPLLDGQLSVNVSHQYVRITSFEGRNLGELSDDGPPIGGVYTVPRLHIGLETDEVTLSTTWGWQHARWAPRGAEINLTVPALYTRLDLEERFQLRFPDEPRGRVRTLRASGSHIGIGDVFVRGKYAVDGGLLPVSVTKLLTTALGLSLRLPSGSKEDFQGTGEVELAPLLIASTRPWYPLDQLGMLDVRTQVYANAGVNVPVGSVDDTEAQWGMGTDLGYRERVVLGIAMLAKHRLSRLIPRGEFERDRFDPATAGVVVRPLFGFHGGRTDAYDLAIGFRAWVWRKELRVFANALVPLNDGGFRADVIPLAGVEMTFGTGASTANAPDDWEGFDR